MSTISQMPRYLISIALLFPVAAYMLHTIFGQEEEAVHENVAAGVAIRAPETNFPLDEDPVDRSTSKRIASFADVLSDVNPAVVGVYPTRILRVFENPRIHPLEEMLRQFYGLPIPRENNGTTEERRVPQGLGSGVIVSSDGYILTNNHVVSEADEITVQLSDKREFEATVVGTDKRTDVAVLKIDAKDFPYLPMADSDSLAVGDIVFAVGNPLGVGLTVTMGIISATGRRNLGLLGQGSDGYEDFIQTDAAINLGNSGGPLVDAEGRLVGINTAIISQSSGNIGIGFAIPISLARDIMLSLISTGTVQRGLLGVNIRNLTQDMAEAFDLESTDGALIERVIDGLPAEAAGLKRGDVIVAVDGESIEEVAELRLKISSIPPGTLVRIAVIRDGSDREFDVTLGNIDSPNLLFGGSSDSILEGVTLNEMNARLREEFDLADEVDGLVVTDVEARSPYSGSLREGMVIVEVNKSPVRSFSDLMPLLKRGANYLWVYDRNGNYGYIAIRLR